MFLFTYSPLFSSSQDTYSSVKAVLEGAEKWSQVDTQSEYSSDPGSPIFSVLKTTLVMRVARDLMTVSQRKDNVSCRIVPEVLRLQWLLINLCCVKAGWSHVF